MAKTDVYQWDTTAANNTDVGGVPTVGTALPSTLDNANREMMAQIASFVTQTGYTSAGGVVYHRKNILGTVSQSSGTPTGAIIERGSNANGEYVRYADGTQECWLKINNADGVTTSIGSLFYSPAEVTWTFPVAFSSNLTLIVTGNGRRSNAATGVAPGSGLATTFVTYRVWSATSIAAPNVVDVALRAVGRWF